MISIDAFRTRRPPGGWGRSSRTWRTIRTWLRADQVANPTSACRGRCAVQPLAVRTVGGGSERQRVIITGADVDLGLDLVATRATTDFEPREAVGEAVVRAVAETTTAGNRAPPPRRSAWSSTTGLVGRLAHLCAASTVTSSTRSTRFGSLIEGDSRNRRRHGHRTTGRRAVRRHVQ